MARAERIRGYRITEASPACLKAYTTRPEQSNADGPVAPYRHGSPYWALAIRTICWASVVAVVAAAGVDGAVLKRMAAAMATGMNARAPRCSVRNGDPSCQGVAWGSRRAMTPAGTHDRTWITGLDRLDGECRHEWDVAGEGARGEPCERVLFEFSGFPC